MYSHTDEAGTLDVLKIKIFFLTNHGGQTFKEFFIFFCVWILQCGDGMYVSFVKKEKKVKVLYISLSPVTRDFREFRDLR